MSGGGQESAQSAQRVSRGAGEQRLHVVGYALLFRVLQAPHLRLPRAQERNPGDLLLEKRLLEAPERLLLGEEAPDLARLLVAVVLQLRDLQQRNSSGR